MYGLYIHIPFCRRKCGYCDFVSYPGREGHFSVYLEMLYKEMEKYLNLPLSTVYVGGGTPTLLSSPHISDLLANIRCIFGTTNLAEVTVEANPESLTEDRLETLKSAGVSRLSIGAQSFSDEELRSLGRVHTALDFERAFLNARQRQFANINIDLIYGLPGQTVDEWLKNLEKALSYHPEHLSLYPLTIETGTDLYRRNAAVDEDLQAELYGRAVAILSRNGYEHYEISNWSRPGFECRHNMIYWQNKEYIGVGVSAASYLQGTRSKNVEDLDEYIKIVSGEGDPAGEKDDIDEQKRLSEEMILKLRCSTGIPLSDAVARRYGGIIERMMKDRLLEKNGDNVRLTMRGKLLANQVFQEFV